MSNEEIITGSKLIAEYLGFTYIPFSVDLKEKGLKPGWYKTVDATPKMEEVTQTSFVLGKEDETEVKRITININNLRYNQKNGYKLVGDKYYKYICRNHGELRYWNDYNKLIEVIEKIQNDNYVKFILYNNGGKIDGANLSSFNSDYSWIQNLFILINKYLTHETRRP